MAKENTLVKRLSKFRQIFNAIFSRTQTVEHALPVMILSVANIVRDAKIIEAGLGHIGEAYFDSQQLSDEFAHLVTFAINLPVTIGGDVSFWSYALDLVDATPGGAFEEGAEGVALEQLILQREALGRVIAHKKEIQTEEEEED